MSDEAEELEPAYVIWESGCIEEFECAEDAQHEMMAMNSRGARGELVNDLIEAITYLGTRLDIPLLPINLNNGLWNELREFAGRYPVAWSADRREDNTRVVLLKAEESTTFRLVLYKMTVGRLDAEDINSKWERTVLPTCGLSELPQLLRRHMTRVGALEAKVAEQAAEIERLKATQK